MMDLATLIAPRATDRILDIGCDRGAWALGLAVDAGYVTGLGFCEDEAADAAAAAIQSGRDNVSFQWQDPDLIAEGLAFGDETFDWICCRWVLSRLEDPTSLLREAARVLKRPGRLLLAEEVGAVDDAARAAEEKIARSRAPQHKHTHSREALTGLLTGTKLTLETHREWTEAVDFNTWMSAVAADESVITRTRRLVKEAAKKSATDWEISVQGQSITMTRHFAVWVCLKV